MFHDTLHVWLKYWLKKNGDDENSIQLNSFLERFQNLTDLFLHFIEKSPNLQSSVYTYRRKYFFCITIDWVVSATKAL